jgi:hypothetical protein
MDETIKTPLRSFALASLLITTLTSSSLLLSLLVYFVSAGIIYFTDFNTFYKK